MEGLILIGTVHLDPGGHDRLIEALRELRPETVTVEVSRYALEYRRSIGPELLGRLEPFRLANGSLPRGMRAVAAQIGLPFEWTASEAWAGRSGALLVPVGDGQLSRQLLERLERELMLTDNLVRLATREEPPLSEQIEREWVRARRQYRKGPALDSAAAARMGTVNRRMARRIRSHAAGVPAVHVGGWEHLFGLREELRDLEPGVRLLSP